MSNYYEAKYQALRNQNINALDRIVEVLLYQSTPPRLPEGCNKFQVFWQSDFIGKLQSNHLSSENYCIAFAQYLRYGNLDKKLCRRVARICPKSFISAVRKSGIISELQHSSWQILNELCRDDTYKELHGFIETVNYLQEGYRQRLNSYQELQKKLNLSQLEVLLYSSLYTYEYLLPDAENYQLTIPYQIDPTCSVTTDKLWQAFDTIIQQTPASRNPVTEKRLALLFRNKLMPFLFGKGLTPILVQEYEQFKLLTALRVELNLYKNFVFHAYSYQDETEYSIYEGELQLNRAGKDNSSENFQEKFSILQSYWQWRGMRECEETPYFLRMDRGKNIEGNLIALSETQGVILRLREVFGIDEEVSVPQSFSLFEGILTLELSQQFYRQDFIDKFNAVRKDGIPPFQALFLLMIEGLTIGENRFPIAFAEKERKAARMSDWILSGSKTAKKKSMTAIMDFWSQDLRQMTKGSFQELPYYQIDGIMLELPHRFGLQNLHTTVVNHFRRLNKNRPSLRKETDSMERQLAECFAKNGWQVLAQYQPDDGNIGEIDLIVIADNHVLVLELKSSFIKRTIREIYEYRHFVLKKAAYQLSRKCSYVKDILLPQLGYASEQMELHSWIVDTTLEFDHQRIDGHLKVSMEELLICLNRHTGFTEHFFEMEYKPDQPLDFVSLLKNIESDRFWKIELPRLPERIRDLKERL